ncbi:DUF4249 domain-containing protein [uncultured Fibrella sp.]|uniref:DUF4249 domain-containing protein n=1 Tax=uncultured Fibrella sp. TaxID=1284596 RepID=UPI0035CB093B
MLSAVQRQLIGFSLLLLLATGGCVDPYRPPEISAPDSYLVMNGFFNSTPGATSTIRLTRTQNLADNKTPILETKAQVTVESQKKTIYTFTESSAGAYTLAGITPQAGELYRLHIRTTKGLDYYSDYVPVVKSPPVDSVSWRVENEGVQINVNTHDPTNNTRYYRWEYEATWEYTADFFSDKELKNNQVVDRQDYIFRCWGNENSTNILTTSTVRLSKDVVSQYPITFVSGTSIKLGYQYSILVKQIGLTQAGFNYYDQLAKLTQNIGSVFDPQPTQVTGNIHSATNDSDIVVGFFRVGSVETKRLFIANAELPFWLNRPGFGGCEITDTMSLITIRRLQPAIISYDNVKYTTTTTECIDCRIRGGTTKRPDFWR